MYVKSDSDGSGGSAEDENNDTTHPTKPVPDFVRQHAKAWNLNLRLVSKVGKQKQNIHCIVSIYYISQLADLPC